MTTKTITAPAPGRNGNLTTSTHASLEEQHLMVTFTPLPNVNRSVEADPREPDSTGPPGLEPDEPHVGRLVARCADGNGTLTGLFFSDHVADIARAKAMCGLCPLRQSCLAGALEREEPWGVWGGELLSGGRVIANKRPCGRPPKRPRPEVVYDEMGPVGVVA